MILTTPRGWLERCDAALGDSSRTLHATLTLHRHDDLLEALVSAEASASDCSLPCVDLVRMREFERGACYLHWLGCERGSGTVPRIKLGLFADGSICGAVALDGKLHPLHSLHITGARAERRSNGNAWRILSPISELESRDGLHSRTLAALGDPLRYEALRRERVCFIGCSRSGDLALEGLARSGLYAGVLIDPKRLAPHHLDASSHAPHLIGEPKVIASAARARAAFPELQLQCFYAPLEDPAAAAAAADCSLLLTCTDRGEPRLLANLISRAYHRTMLDLGTGIVMQDGRWSAGADVRLLLPGREEPCILCAGGVDLRRPERGPEFRRERLGSLRSLNGVAVNYALFLYEQLATGEIEHSLWVRLRLDRRGELVVEREVLRARSGCTLCEQAGAGDGVWL